MSTKPTVFGALTGILVACCSLCSVVACNKNGNPDAALAALVNQTITVNAFTFSPLELTAKPGEIIRVVNNDSTTHTVTSESIPNAFDNNGDFDTNELNAGHESAIAVPAGAAVGSHFFFYCDIHEDMMTTPNGTITVIAP